jgi:tetratricopeptide (TPR) repeat protein
MFLKSILPAALLVACTSAFGQTLIEKADKQYELHAYRLAAKSYESILARNTDEWAASLRLADCYLHLNELEKAVSQYARAVSDGHAQSADYLNYGRVLMMLGRYETAEKQFEVYSKVNDAVANQFIQACQYARSNGEGASEFDVTPLSKINTSGAEFGVSFWKDNLIWSSTRSDYKRGQSSGSKNDLINGESNQLFIAPIEGVSRQAFKINFLKNDLRNTFNESHPSYSADGKMVAFTRNNIAEDERITSNGGLEMSLFLADVDADGNWLNVKPYPYNSGSTGFPSFGSDSKTLYFASNREGGKGGFDIYKAELKGSFWGEPKNLGSNINSYGDEITPYFDGSTLYFSSDWHFGFGGYDVFRVEGGDVINMGTGINSSGDDYGFIFNPSVSLGFFVSNRQGSKGKDDIYEAKTNGQTANIVVLENGKPLKDTKIKVTQGNAGNLTLLKGGNYLLNLADHQPLTIEVVKEGFKNKSVQIAPDYTNASRVVEVAMERNVPTQMSNVPEYIFVVTDGSSGEPLEGVIVRLTNQANNTQAEYTTDVKGKFKFPMTANTNVHLTFSKEGFVVGQKFVKHSEAKSLYLGEIPLKPSAVTNKIDMSASTAQTPPKVDKKPDPIIVYSIPVKPSSIKKSPDASEEKEPEKNVKPLGYAVQITILKLNDVLSTNKFDDLKPNGNLYSVPEGDVNKLRLGIFKTREEAAVASKKVIDLGYQGAFVVEEKNEQAVAKNLFTPIPKPIKPIPTKVDDKQIKGTVEGDKGFIPVPPKTQQNIPPPYTATAPNKKDPQPKPKPTTVAPPKKKDVPKSASIVVPPKPAVVVEDKTFKVRIAAMKKPEWFDESKVSKLGKIEKIQEGDLTIFIIAGFKTLQDAKNVKQKVKDAGYGDAKVIQKDGKVFKVVD